MGTSPGSCNASSWTLALVKVSPELDTGKATVPDLAPDGAKPLQNGMSSLELEMSPAFGELETKASKIQFDPNVVSTRSLWRKNLPPGR